MVVVDYRSFLTHMDCEALEAKQLAVHGEDAQRPYETKHINAPASIKKDQSHTESFERFAD